MAAIPLCSMPGACALQCGPAFEIYHRPATIRASEVFSDPPIYLICAVIGPQGCRLSPSVAFPLAQHMRALPPGDYRVGMRAGHIGLVGHDEYGCLIPAKVELAEINGSETYVHAGHGDFQMIAMLQGVHDFGLGDEIRLYLDPRRCSFSTAPASGGGTRRLCRRRGAGLMALIAFENVAPAAWPPARSKTMHCSR